jgi:TonB-linked SusC/RagA family outer membrane protein
MKDLQDVGIRHLLIGIMLIFSTNIVLAQEKTISGIITGTDNEPIIGASVLEKGTSNGTVTDLNGSYSISVESTAVLVISYIGMESQEIAVNNKSVINIQLKESSIGLDEVVVVGYGTMMKKDLSSAITKVDGSVLHNQPLASAGGLLIGKSSGVQVTTNSGEPGSDITIRIRGANSFSGNSPLYVIDGVPSGDILGLNPNDIESIEVLKDASSSAIYGSRAANGVILITTKQGVKGRTDISFNTYFGLQRVYKRMEMMNAQQQWDYVLKGVENYNRLNPNAPVVPRDQGVADHEAGYNTDWQDEVFRIAPVQNYSFSASGGTDKMKFSTNVSYYNQKGVIISNGYERYTARFNMDYELNRYLSVGTSLKAYYSHKDEIPKGDSESSIMANLLRKMAYEPVFEPDGTYSNRERPNLVASANLYQGDSYRKAGIGTVYAKLKIIDRLELTTTWSGDIGVSTGNSFTPSTILGGATRPSSAYSNKWSTWISENILSYSFEYRKHKANAILGYSMQESDDFNFNASASGGPSDLISTMNASTTKGTIYSYKTGWGINSLFARVNYSFASKYLIGLSIRNDGSSRFGANNRYARFPAGSIAWRIKEEGFMKSLTMIDDLKIRASMGRTGNQNIGNYAAQGAYNTGVNYAGQPGVRVGGIPAADLTWESTDQYDGGLDLTMFNGRLAFSFDYYLKKTQGLLFSMPIPGYTGFGSYMTNLGEIENKGVELSIDGDIIRNKDLNWSAGFNISFNKNKVISLPNHTPIITTVATEVFYTSNGTFYTQEGQPIGEFYALKWTGEVYPTDEIAREHVSSIMGQAPVGGTLKYEDFNDDGKIDANDRQVVGSPHPKFFGGLNTNLSYKSFDIGLQFSFMYGNKLFNQMRFLSSRGFCYDAALVERVDAWSKPGDITTEHKVLTSTDARDNQFSSKYVEDGSYLRLNNMNIGYNLPASITNVINVNNVRVFLSAQNLFTITKYKGYDPEVNAKSGSIHTQGVDIGMIPQVSTYMIGLNVNF